MSESDIKEDAIRLVEHLIASLRKENEEREACCARLAEENKKLRSRKQYLQNILRMPENETYGLNGSNCIKECCTLFEQNANVVDDASKLQADTFSEYIAQYKQHCENLVKTDEYTMLPYHDVETAINDVKNEKQEIFNELHNMEASSESRCNALNEELKQLELENETFKKYEEELTAAEQQKNCAESDAIKELENEIAQLERQCHLTQLFNEK